MKSEKFHMATPEKYPLEDFKQRCNMTWSVKTAPGLWDLRSNPGFWVWPQVAGSAFCLKLAALLEGHSPEATPCPCSSLSHAQRSSSVTAEIRIPANSCTCSSDIDTTKRLLELHFPLVVIKQVYSAWVSINTYLKTEDPLEKGMATHSSIFAWRIPRTEKSGGPQPIGSQRIRHNWSDLAHKDRKDTESRISQ